MSNNIPIKAYMIMDEFLHYQKVPENLASEKYAQRILDNLNVFHSRIYDMQSNLLKVDHKNLDVDVPYFHNVVRYKV